MNSSSLKNIFSLIKAIASCILYTALMFCTLVNSYALQQKQDPDIYFGQDRGELSRVGYTQDSIKIHLDRAAYFLDTRPNKDSALFYGHKAYHLSQIFQDSSAMAKAKVFLARGNAASGDYDLAMADIKFAIWLSLKLKDKKLQYDTLNRLGIIQLKAGKLDMALKTYLDLVDYYKSQNDHDKLTKVYNNIGVIYLNLNDQKKARSFFELAIHLCNEIGNLALCESSYQNMASVVMSDKNYEEAIQYNNYALDIALKNDNSVTIERIYSNMAYIYYLLKDYANAILYSQKSLNIFSRKREDYGIIEANTLHTLGLAYLEKKNYNKALDYLNVAHDTGTKLNYIENLPEFELGLYTYYDQIGNYKEALKYYKDYVKANDKLSGTEIQTNISEIEEAYFTLKKEKEMDALVLKKEKEEEKLKSRIYFFGGIAGAIGILFIAFVQRQKRNIAENRELISKNKYNSLRSQMNPHFIFNTINGVQNQILKSDKLTAYNHLNKFASTIRLMLDNSTRSFILLEKEIELIKHYVLLESVRFSEKFSFEINVSEELETLNPTIPSMIIQPIVENAIIHGLSNKEGVGHLKVKLFLQDGFVRCIVEDNGIGRIQAMKIKNRKLDLHLSVATENTQQRIKLLRKLGYKKSAIIYTDLTDEYGASQGTKVDIVLPIKHRK